MTLSTYIENNGIRQADAIIVKKEWFGILDHYVIFLGYDTFTGEPKFIANYGDGVSILSTTKLFQFLKDYKPVSIRRFNGSENDRKYAVKRALNELETGDSNSYHLIKNNCEHFANLVQKGVRESDQVKALGVGTAAGGVGMVAAGLANDNDDLVIGGLFLALLGGLTASMGTDLDSL